jgi:hypothetical protein
MNTLPLWRASSILGKQVGPLLDLQLWLFGRDIVHPSGNRLLAQGFSLRRSPGVHDHCSVYESSPLTLWAFGLVWRGPERALYLPRNPYAPKLLPEQIDISNVWSKRDLPATSSPINADEAELRGLLGAAFLFLAEYEAEAWVFDPLWRKKSVQNFKKSKIAPESLAQRWQDAAHLVLPLFQARNEPSWEEGRGEERALGEMGSAP